MNTQDRLMNLRRGGESLTKEHIYTYALPMGIYNSSMKDWEQGRGQWGKGEHL